MRTYQVKIVFVLSDDTEPRGEINRYLSDLAGTDDPSSHIDIVEIKKVP